MWIHAVVFVTGVVCGCTLFWQVGGGYYYHSLLLIERRKIGKRRYRRKGKRKQLVPTSGYVYFVTHKDRPQVVKIGRAVNVENRVRDFETSSVSGIWVIGFIKCRNMYTTEAFLHEAFSYNRFKGEWFRVDITLLVLMLLVRRENEFQKYLLTQKTG